MADKSQSIYTRYFVFSKSQMNERLRIEASISATRPKLGTVIVNGVAKEYTDIVTDMSRCRYGDSILITKGDIRKINFTTV